MNHRGIGIDIVEIARFRKLKNISQNKFIHNNFSPIEQKYCLSYKDSALHLAGTFAAKEATLKALGKNDILLSSIEIRRRSNGYAEAYLNGRKLRDIMISISHTDTIASAIAIKF